MSDGRAVLKDVTRFAEQLRFLLAQHNSRLSLDALRDLYALTFGPPPDTEGKDWLGTKLIQYAPHVVNLTGNQWVIWAPAGRPYPARPLSKLASHSPSTLYGKQTVDYTGTNWGVGFTNAVSVGGKESGVQDLIDMEEGGRELMEKEVIGAAPIVTASSTHTPSYRPLHTTHTSNFSSSPGGATDKPRITQHSETTPPCPPLPPLFTDLLLHSTTEGLEHSSSSSTSNQPQREEKVVEYDYSPYGFLERDPDLLAQFTVKEVDEKNAVSNEESLQRLLECGNLMDYPLIPDLPPPQLTPLPPPFIPDLPPPILPNLPPPLVPVSLSPPSHSTNSNDDEKPSPVTHSSPRGTSLPTDSTTDYLKAGLKPDEVLQELYRVKDLGGGVINPASMEPFLSYFGELSSRELERLESQEAKRVPKPLSPTPTKGMLRKKRMMAIRFPGQESDVDPELQKTLDSLQLPEVRSDSSGDEGDPSVPVQPLNRAELVEELMNRGDPLPLRRDREDNSQIASGGFDGSKPAFCPPYY